MLPALRHTPDSTMLSPLHQCCWRHILFHIVWIPTALLILFKRKCFPSHLFGKILSYFKTVLKNYLICSNPLGLSLYLIYCWLLTHVPYVYCSLFLAITQLCLRENSEVKKQDCLIFLFLVSKTYCLKGTHTHTPRKMLVKWGTNVGSVEMQTKNGTTDWHLF